MHCCGFGDSAHFKSISQVWSIHSIDVLMGRRHSGVVNKICLILVYFSLNNLNTVQDYPCVIGFLIRFDIYILNHFWYTLNFTSFGI